jgi:hypothetical protein
MGFAPCQKLSGDAEKVCVAGGLNFRPAVYNLLSAALKSPASGTIAFVGRSGTSENLHIRPIHRQIRAGTREGR